MKTILIIAAALWSLQINAQHYHLKKSTTEQRDKTGVYYVVNEFVQESGYIELNDFELTIRQEDKEELTYTIITPFEENLRGLYFRAVIEGVDCECWYNVDELVLKIKKGKEIIYYHFKPIA